MQMNERLLPPVSYQGAKQRISSQIVDVMDRSGCNTFYDLCCGSGSIALEMVSRGFYKPEDIVMVDAGPWGLFWEAVGNREFKMYMMEYWCNQVPSDRIQIKTFMQELSRTPVDSNAPYVFLLLQAASFGGKAIWIKEGRWQNCSFRSYWQPTENSNRRSPVNPMMPMPETLYNRVFEVVSTMEGVKGMCKDVECVIPEPEALVYIDPDYKGTTGYGHTLNVQQYSQKLSCRHYISEGEPLSSNAVLISSGRSKGGISGERQSKANEEWLSGFNLTHEVRKAA